MTIGLELTRSQILAFRRHAASLDERLPRGQDALRRAAWAGLQDSMPRAALLSIHARMSGTEPETWEDAWHGRQQARRPVGSEWRSLVHGDPYERDYFGAFPFYPGNPRREQRKCTLYISQPGSSPDADS